MNELVQRLVEITAELAEISEKLKNHDFILINNFFEANKKKLRLMSECNDIVIISTTKELWSKHSEIFEGNNFHYSFLKGGTKLTTEFLHNINKNPNVSFFNI